MSIGLTQAIPRRFVRSPLLREEKSVWDSSYAPLIVHFALVVYATLVYVIAQDPIMSLIASGAVALPTYLLMAWLEVRRAPLILSPLSYYLAWYSICFGGSAIDIALRFAEGETISFVTASVDPEEAAVAYVIAIVGSFCLHVGVQLRRPVSSPDSNKELQVGPVARDTSVEMFLLWVAGVVVRLFPKAASALGTASGILSWGSSAALCAYAISHRSRDSRHPFFYFLLTCGIIVELAFNLRSGSKAYIMLAFLPLVWLLMQQRALRVWLIPAMTCLVVLYMKVVAPVVTAARNSGDTSADKSGHIVATLQEGQYQSEQREGALEAFLERQFDVTPIAYLYHESELYGFRYGETMTYIFYAFIPRIIWPDKPVVTRGDWFTAYIMTDASEKDAPTSTGQTAIGELYWNFGLPGVIFGMFVIGMLVGSVWRLAGDEPYKEPLRMLLYLALTFGMPDMPEAVTTTVGIIYKFLVFGFLSWMFVRVKRLRAAESLDDGAEAQA